MKIARRKFKVEVPSMAMGDIAFNLLVFFVILAKVQDDSHLQWKPATTATLDTGKHAKVRIVVDKDSKLYLNGQEIAQASLTAQIETLLKDVPVGDRTVLLKIDSNAQAVRFEPVLQAAGEAGGEIVHILQKSAGN